MKKYNVLFLITVNFTFFGMEKNYLRSAINEIRAERRMNRSFNDLLDNFKPFPEAYNFCKELKDTKELTKNQIWRIINLGYSCFCEDTNNKCHQTVNMPCVLGKNLLHFILAKTLSQTNKQDFFDVIVNDYVSHYCALRVILHYIEPYKQFYANYYLVSIIDAASNFLNAWKNNPIQDKQFCLNADNRLTSYAAILIESNVEVSFFSIRLGQNKLNSLNGEYFPKLKQMLENAVIK